MVYSSNLSSKTHHPPPSLSAQILPLLLHRLPPELALHILNLARLFSRSWVRRLECLPSKAVSSRAEYMRVGMRTVLQSKGLGRRRLRKVVLSVRVAPLKVVWAGKEGSGPGVLRVALIRPLPPEGRGNCEELVVQDEPLDIPWAEGRTTFTFVFDEGSFVEKAQYGDRIRVCLLPHYRMRSGAVPMIKEVTIYLYTEW